MDALLVIGLSVFIIAVVWTALAFMGIWLARLLQRRIRARIDRAWNAQVTPPSGELLMGSRPDR